MDIELYSSAGISPQCLAHRTRIPPFVTGAPEVVIWGNRVFTLAKPLPPDRDDTHRYVETFAYAIPPGL